VQHEVKVRVHTFLSNVLDSVRNCTMSHSSSYSLISPCKLLNSVALKVIKSTGSRVGELEFTSVRRKSWEFTFTVPSISDVILCRFLVHHQFRYLLRQLSSFLSGCLLHVFRDDVKTMNNFGLTSLCK
jgi:hypothetical protein